MRNPPDHQQDVEQALSEDLIGEIDLSGTGESDLWDG
jgi:hypothetical protein